MGDDRLKSYCCPEKMSGTLLGVEDSKASFTPEELSVVVSDVCLFLIQGFLFCGCKDK